MRDTERERQRHRQREKQTPHRKPDVGLDPGTPGSRPSPKAGAKLLSHPGIPLPGILKALRNPATRKPDLYCSMKHYCDRHYCSHIYSPLCSYNPDLFNNVPG